MCGQASPGKWTIQYFYDDDRTQLEIVDLAFPSATRGIAAGLLLDRTAKRKPTFTTLVTSDGGDHWTLIPLKEEPRSLFFLDDSKGWLVTSDAIWMTQESGRSWTRIAAQPRPDRKIGLTPPGGLILKVRFLDDMHGYAIGYQKTVLETRDGGRTWAPVEEAGKPTGNPAFTTYTHIVFDGLHGLIAGASNPPRLGESPLPSWLTPEESAKQRERPTLIPLLETIDGGAHWRSSTAPLLGRVSSLKISGRSGLTVWEYADSFEWPGEVYRLNLTTGASESSFRAKNRRVTDAALFPTAAFLAAVEPAGRLNSSPVPGKVKFLESRDLESWTEMRTDYKAVASMVTLAGPDADHQWAATDTGMILHLSR
jgi:Photosynthesis system II assembly factor YCF48